MEPRARTAGEMTLSTETMVSLIRRMAGGDSSALLTLYDGTSPLVYGLAMKILGERTAAEETLLDVYTQAWKQSACTDSVDAPLEWLAALARNSALARIPSGKKIRKKQEPSNIDADSLPTVAPEQQSLARSSLASISPAERELLELAYCSGLSCAEMAAQIGRPLGAVKSQIRRGLIKLTESFSPSSGHEIEEAATGGGREA